MINDSFLLNIPKFLDDPLTAMSLGFARVGNMKF